MQRVRDARPSAQSRGAGGEGVSLRGSRVRATRKGCGAGTRGSSVLDRPRQLVPSLVQRSGGKYWSAFPGSNEMWAPGGGAQSQSLENLHPTEGLTDLPLRIENLDLDRNTSPPQTFVFPKDRVLSQNPPNQSTWAQCVRTHRNLENGHSFSDTRIFLT